MRSAAAKSFDSWTPSGIKYTFGLIENAESPLLKIWSQANCPISKVDFLVPNRCHAFYKATISATLKDVNGVDMLLRGRPELAVAAGDEEPKQPFFFLNEYKPQIKTQKNPQGQLLIAMLTAQTKNGVNTPLYGLYIMGQNWRFVTHTKKNLRSDNFSGASYKPHRKIWHTVFRTMPSVFLCDSTQNLSEYQRICDKQAVCC